MTGETIRTARERAGESQAQFAVRFGVNQSTIHRWETDGPPPGGPARKMIEQVVAQIGADAEAA